jgi:hypothetical protein
MSRWSVPVQYLHTALKIVYGPRRLCTRILDFPAVRKGMLMRRQSYVTSYFYEHSYNSVQLEPRDRIVCDTRHHHHTQSLFYFWGFYTTVLLTWVALFNIVLIILAQVHGNKQGSYSPSKSVLCAPFLKTSSGRLSYRKNEHALLYWPMKMATRTEKNRQWTPCSTFARVWNLT